jgi:hypothetical protein
MGSRPGRATVLAAALMLTLSLAAAALAWSQPQLGDNRPLGVGSAADGALRIVDSRGEAAILEAPALAPGAAVAGGLTIENRGAPAGLELSRGHLTERLGTGGASLAAVLRLRIRDLTDGGGKFVYRGSLAAMPTLHLGSLQAGESRRYRFVARLPEPGLVDNSLMGRRIRVDYRWRLRRQ